MAYRGRFRTYRGGEALLVEEHNNDDNDYSIERFQDLFVDVYKALRPYPDALRAVERTLAERLLEQDKNGRV